MQVLALALVRQEPQTESVRPGSAVAQPGGSGHPGEALLRDHLTVLERSAPARQVDGRRPRGPQIRFPRRFERGAAAPVSLRDVGIRARRPRSPLGMESPEAGGSRQLADRLVVGLATQGGDDVAQQVVVGLAVREPGARRKVERLSLECPDVLEPELALLGQSQDCRGGELLLDRADGKQGLRRHGDPAIDVRPPVSSRKGDGVPLQHRHGDAREPPRAPESPDLFVDCLPVDGDAVGRPAVFGWAARREGGNQEQNRGAQSARPLLRDEVVDPSGLIHESLVFRYGAARPDTRRRDAGDAESSVRSGNAVDGHAPP